MFVRGYFLVQRALRIDAILSLFVYLAAAHGNQGFILLRQDAGAE
jgi:hypothetical protein